MTTAEQRARCPIPPLQDGDHLTRAEFERRYDLTPGLKKAELIEGVVHMPPPPVSHAFHSDPDQNINGWLWTYRAASAGVAGGTNGSLRLDLDNEPQPDAYLLIDPACGGQAKLDDEGYVAGAPELVAEIAASSASYDLHEKLRVYRRNGVREYVVWRTYDADIDWFVLRDDEFQRQELPADGIYRSSIFPGLWLAARAMIAGELPEVLRVVQAGIASSEHATFVEQLRQRREASAASAKQ